MPYSGSNTTRLLAAAAYGGTTIAKAVGFAIGKLG